MQRDIPHTDVRKGNLKWIGSTQFRQNEGDGVTGQIVGSSILFGDAATKEIDAVIEELMNPARRMAEKIFTEQRSKLTFLAKDCWLRNWLNEMNFKPCWMALR